MLIAALASTGLHGTNAVAAVVLYRIIALKILISVAWPGCHYLMGRRRAEQSLQRPG